MDNIFGSRLVLFFLFFIALWGVSCPSAAADNLLRSQAYAECMAAGAETIYIDTTNPAGNATRVCLDNPGSSTFPGSVAGYFDSTYRMPDGTYSDIAGSRGGTPGYTIQYFNPTSQQCLAQGSHHFGATDLTAEVTACHSGCMWHFVPDPGQVQVCLGGKCTSGMSGMLSPTGSTCPVASPSGPDPDAYSSPPLPKLCGGGSCYDPASGKYCAVGADGQQVCVDAQQAANGGDSFSSGDTALTAGNPPPKAPNPPISNPPTDIQSSDTYTQNVTDAQGDSTSGQPITVNVYGANGSTTSSGQGEGDTGPAPPSSTGGSSGSVSGGLDCNTPPICSGDVVNCAVVNQSWLARCHNHDDLEQLHKDLAGTEAPPDAGEVSQGDVWQEGVPGGSAIGQAALQGDFDESGFGYSIACPLKDLTISLPGGRSFVVPFTKGCQYGDWLRNIILAFAIFAAARIIAKG